MTATTNDRRIESNSRSRRATRMRSVANSGQHSADQATGHEIVLQKRRYWTAGPRRVQRNQSTALFRLLLPTLDAQDELATTTPTAR
jgi:hypothetical protein